MNRIKVMAPISKVYVHMVKSEPVLVIEEDKRYWAILDKSILTTLEGEIDDAEIINRNGIIYLIGGRISMDE